MSGIWLVSYIVLWTLVVTVCFLLVGGLREIGLLRLQATQRSTTEPVVPSIEHDGPSIGSHLPNIAVQAINGFGSGTLSSWRSSSATLVMFMTALCESCQHSAEPLNALADDAPRGVQPIAIMQADDEACRAFMAVFPLRLPLICDSDRAITNAFDVQRASFGLLYDKHGTLIRKGSIDKQEDLLVLDSLQNRIRLS